MLTSNLMSSSQELSTKWDIYKCVLLFFFYHYRAIRKHQGSFGEIHLTVRYATLRNKLIVLVDACRYFRQIQPHS